MPELSVVIPCFNERQNVGVLVERLTAVLSTAVPSFEIVFVDDGSTDDGPAMIAQMAARDARVKLISFSRNFGHQAALAAGLDAAEGKAVVLMDADLQDPPEVVPQLVERWRAGSEVVYAVRRNRKEGIAKRAAYALFYRSMKMIAAVDLPLDAGDFSLLDRKVVDALKAMPERSRFLRGLRSWVGFRQEPVEYDRPARLAGETKYSLRKLVGLALSGYIGFSAFPLRLASWLGFAAAFTGFALTSWVLAHKVFGIAAPWGWASTAALILFMGGVQLIVLGVMGEYLGRMYDEVRGRPTYVVREKIGFGSQLLAARRREMS
jgi:glycosyltransferase involved in cell wall biosynthesis